MDFLRKNPAFILNVTFLPLVLIFWINPEYPHKPPCNGFAPVVVWNPGIREDGPAGAGRAASVPIPEIMHSTLRYLLFKPRRLAVNGGLWSAAVIAVINLSAVALLRAQSEGPPVVPDPLVSEYGPQLVPLSSSAIGGVIASSAAAPAGADAWLTAWTERSASPLFQPASYALKVRMLNKAFEDSPGWDAFFDASLLPPIQEAGRVDTNNIAIRVTPGSGGAWLTWQSENRILTRWYDGASGKAVGDTLPLSPAGETCVLLSAASDGTTGWVVWSSSPGGGAGISGAVTGVKAQGPEIRARFALPNGFQPQPAAAARSEFCLFSSPGGYPDYVVTTIRVDATGGVAPARYVTLDFGDQWLGVIPHKDGWYPVTGHFYPAAKAWTLQGRWLSVDGAWPENAKPEVLGPMAADTADISFFAGPSAGMVIPWLNGGSPAWKVVPRQPLALQTGDYPELTQPGSREYAMGGTKMLSISRGTMLQARRLYEDYSRSPVTAVLTEGIGFQSALSLVWTERGPQAVFQLAGYVPPGATGVAAGYNKAADSADGVPLSLDDFTSPAQAWIGGTQLIAYRGFGAVGETESMGSDDVFGVIYKIGENGALQAAGAPFVIATGPASQRGVAVAPLGSEGFLVAWREETGRFGTGDYVATVRAAMIGLDGRVYPPNGRIVDISRQELSAVSVAGGAYSGTILWKQAQADNPKRAEIRMVELSYGFGAIPAARTISLPAQDAVGPQGLVLGNRIFVTWRDKRSGRIQINQGQVLGGLNPAEAVPVSAPALGADSREPWLAVVSPSLAAAFWLEPAGGGRMRVMVCLLNVSGGISPPAKVAEGIFDPDLLVASGDGQGRVAVGVCDIESIAVGLRIFMVAPAVSRQGGLQLELADGAPQVSWDASPVFPGLAETVETSSDLLDWKPVAGNSNPAVTSDSSGRSTLSLPAAAAGADPRRYYRLRAVLKAAGQ